MASKKAQLRSLCTSCQEVEENAGRLADMNGVGGVISLVRGAGTTVEAAAQGLPSSGAVALQRSAFGANVLPETPRSTWTEEFIKCLKEDEIVQVLCVSAVVSLAIGTWENPQTGWIEGTAINLAVLIVGAVTATNETQSAEQFEALDSEEKDILVKVLRGGNAKTEVRSSALVVGDVVVLEPGDKAPADCLLLPGERAEVDEAALTGETKAIRKSSGGGGGGGGGGGEADPFLFAGSTVSSCAGRGGCCRALVYLVGADTQLGRLMARVRRPEQKTPLAVRLDALAEAIGEVGKAAALATFLATTLLFSYGWLTQELPPPPDALSELGAGGEGGGVSAEALPFGGLPLSERSWRNLFGPALFGAALQSFLLAVTIVVVAVPEGLPLAVTISLAYSVKSMLKDNNLVRKMKACETMGNATTICSDKTGTLTTNKMSVVRAVAFGTGAVGGPADFAADGDEGRGLASFTSLVAAGGGEPEALKVLQAGGELSTEQALVLGVALNTTADLKDSGDASAAWEVIGNKTEGALLLLLQAMGVDYAAARRAFGSDGGSGGGGGQGGFGGQKFNVRVAARRAFSSQAKIMSVLVLWQEQVGDGASLTPNPNGFEVVELGPMHGVVFTKGAAEIVVERCASIAGSDASGGGGGGSDGSADGAAVAAGLVSPTKAVALQRVPVFSPTPLGADEQKAGGGYRDIIDDMEDEDEDYGDGDEDDEDLDEMDDIDVDDIDRFAGASPGSMSPGSPGGRAGGGSPSSSPSILDGLPSPGAFGAGGKPLSFKDVALLKLKEKRKRERRQKLLAIKKMRAMAERSTRRAEAAKRRQLRLVEQQRQRSSSSGGGSGSGSGSSSLDDASRAAVLGTIEDFNRRSLRSLALAHRCLSPDETAALLDAEMAAAAAAAHGGSGFHVGTGGGGGGGGGGNMGEPTLGDLGLSVEQWDGLGLDAGLTLDAVVGIKDPLRPNVKDAVGTCQAAGITVRMVTGDNEDTARAIAVECGILKSGAAGDGSVMTGPAFRSRYSDLIAELERLAKEKADAEDAKGGGGGGGGGGDDGDEEDEAEDGGNNDVPVMDVPAGAAAELRALRVLARSSPDDKHHLVRLLQCLGEVVGVTGDGMNDGPALKAAQVGLAMNICGTDVAKEASDIIIMDDNFGSIVNTVKWGRCVFDNIRRFLQFQLTVNAVALTVTFLTAALGLEPPLNAVMMLWVNLIMDTMGALALATELPTPQLLSRRPYPLDAPLISGLMWRNIAVQSCFQLAALAWVLSDYGAAYLKGHSDEAASAAAATANDLFLLNPDGTAGAGIPVPSSGAAPVVGEVEKNTLVFSAFVACQVFNEINARSIGNDVNVFRRISTNPWFLSILAATVVTQYLLVTFGGGFTRTCPLSPREWVLTTLIGFLSLPVGVLMRYMPAPGGDGSEGGGDRESGEDGEKEKKSLADDVDESPSIQAENSLDFLTSPETLAARNRKARWDWVVSALYSLVPAYVVFAAIVAFQR